MHEWILNKLIYYGKSNFNYRFWVLNYIRNKILKYHDPIVQIIIGNKLLSLNFSHQLPIYLVKFNLYDTALPRLLKAMGRDKTLNIVDVGANVGDSTALIKSFNKNVRILCIEGNSAYSKLLHKNFDNDDSVIIEDVFCSDNNETITTKLSTKNGTASIESKSSGSEYTFSTLDDIVDKHFSDVDLIKVDTDGYDYKVLRGSLKILKDSQPIVFFELDKSFLSKNNENIMSIFKLFEDYKYESFILYDNFGFILGLFSFSQVDIVENIINYMDSKSMYLDVLMIHDQKVAEELFKMENEAIERILKK